MSGKRLQPWQKRIRDHVKTLEISAEQIAEKVGADNASTVRSWLNGTRRIKLDSFLKLCEAAKIDPAVALFGGPVMHEDHVAALRQISSAYQTPSKPQAPSKRSGNGGDDTPAPRPPKPAN